MRPRPSSASCATVSRRRPSSSRWCSPPSTGSSSFSASSRDTLSSLPATTEDLIAALEGHLPPAGCRGGGDRAAAPAAAACAGADQPAARCPSRARPRRRAKALRDDPRRRHVARAHHGACLRAGADAQPAARVDPQAGGRGRQGADAAPVGPDQRPPGFGHACAHEQPLSRLFARLPRLIRETLGRDAQEAVARHGRR